MPLWGRLRTITPLQAASGSGNVSAAILPGLIQVPVTHWFPWTNGQHRPSQRQGEVVQCVGKAGWGQVACLGFHVWKASEDQPTSKEQGSNRLEAYAAASFSCIREELGPGGVILGDGNPLYLWVTVSSSVLEHREGLWWGHPCPGTQHLLLLTVPQCARQRVPQPELWPPLDWLSPRKLGSLLVGTGKKNMALKSGLSSQLCDILGWAQPLQTSASSSI